MSSEGMERVSGHFTGVGRRGRSAARASSERWSPFSIYLLLLVGILLTACQDHSITRPETYDLLDRLKALPDVEAREISPYWGYPRAFELDITQPVDHRNPTGPTFTQRAYLSHVAEWTPMVFAPSGYAVNWRSGQELGAILSTNCLNVTHRFFRYSRPEPTDWQYLTVWQSAQDHHRIVTLLKEIYYGPWVSSGVSKSGETVLFHRRFYPDDVDATVAYVAPLLFSPEDPRFEPHFETVGTSEEREAIHRFQRMLLERWEELLPAFAAWFTDRGYEMSLPLGPVFESEVVSYEWSYWQRHIFGPEDIPGPDATPEEVIDHLAIAVRLDGTADSGREYFQAYVYQARTEIGYPTIDTSHLDDLLIHESLDTREAYSFPSDLEFVYRYETIPDVLSWLQTHGDRIIYIYGSLDPWTAGAVELTGQADALRIVQEGEDHGVRIADLDQADLVLRTLEDWLGWNIDWAPSYTIGFPDFARPASDELRIFNRPPIW